MKVVLAISTVLVFIEISSHPESLLNPPDRPDIPTASRRCSRALWSGREAKAIAGRGRGFRARQSGARSGADARRATKAGAAPRGPIRPSQ